MPRRPSLRLKVIAGLGSLVLLVGGFIGYQLLNDEPPSFRRGGNFANAAGPGATATTATTAVAAPAPEATTPDAAPAAPSTSGPAPSSTTTTRRAPTSATTVTTAAAVGASTTPSTAAPAPPAPAEPGPAAAARPAFGTYTYAVDGQEGASFVGSRRYPERMTTVVHGGRGVQPDQAVFDVTYSSEHEERQIIGFRADGIYFDFEGGSVTFGPRTETSQADYDPPMIQIPKPLQAGLTRTQVVQAKGVNGEVLRTEDVTARVIGQETVSVAGANVATWKVEVDRKIRPGSTDAGNRKRTYWLDPGRNIWVKYSELFHGERHTAGVNFTYDSNLTATLVEFRP